MKPPAWFGLVAAWQAEFDSRLHPELRALLAGTPLVVRTHRLMLRSAGLCRQSRSRDHWIRLSHHLDEAEARETFGHEYAHRVVDLLYQGRRIEGPHGVEWRMIMRELGLAPLAHHNIPLFHRWERERALRGPS